MSRAERLSCVIENMGLKCGNASAPIGPAVGVNYYKGG